MSSLPRKIAAAIGCTLGVATLVVQAQCALELQAEGKVWKHGELATDVSVAPRGERSRTFVDAGTEILTVTYATREGTRHTARLYVRTLNTPLDDREPPTARYDARDPRRIALSWLQNLSAERWQAVVFAACLALGVIVLSWRLVR